MSGRGFDTHGSEVLRSGGTEHAAHHVYSTVSNGFMVLNNHA